MYTFITKLSLTTAALAMLALVTGCRQLGGTETFDATDGAEEAGSDADEASDGYHEEGAVGSAADPLVEGTIYRLRNLNSQLCMDIPTACNPNEVDGCLSNPIIQTSCNGGPTQHFELVSQGDGSHKLRHVKTGLVIMMAGPCMDNGGIAVLYNDTTNALYPNRKFTLSAPDENGYVCISSVYSGRFLNVPGSSTKPGAALYQYGAACTSPAQRWRPEAI